MSSVKQVLENPNPTTIEVLKCTDILNLLRTNDQKLMEFLLQPQHIKDIFDILSQTFARSDHRRVMQLFQTNNVNLHRIFAESIPLTEYALKVLTSPTDHNMYAAGTISRIFQRAIDLWPDEIYDVFHYSDKLYQIVIDNIDKDVIYMSLLDSLTDEKEFFAEMMWYLFLALVKTSNEKSDSSEQIKFDHPPRRCYLSKDIYPQLPSFGTSNCKILNTINVLKQYFTLKKPCTEDFAEYVIDFIIKRAKSNNSQNPFYYQYYDIAKAIGHNEELQEIAIESVKQASKVSDSSSSSPSLRSPLIISALSYLEVCAKHLDERTFKSLVVTMIDKRNTQFGLLSTVQIVRTVKSANPDWFRHFKDLMEKVIACAWNKYHIDQPLIVSILIDLSILLSVEETSSPAYATNLKQWERKDFILSAVSEQSEVFDFDLEFPESSYDIDELNQLRWGLPF